MSVKHMILGGLITQCGHGYGLKSEFMEALFSDFGVNDGQLYPMLKKMLNEGLITKEIEHQDGAPSRHIYSITDNGRNEFIEWLKSSGGEDRPFRYDFIRKDPFLLRLIHIRNLDKESAIKKVQDHIEIVKNTIRDFETAQSDMTSKGIDIFRISIVQLGLKEQQVRLEWLNDLLEEMKKRKKFK